MNPTPSLLKRCAMAAAAATLAAALMATSPSPASAAEHSVDPSTLTPPPPEFFNASCRSAGQQILCDLAFVDPNSPVEEQTDIFCGSGSAAFEVLDTWTRSVRGTRYYSADGLLLRRHFNDEWDGTFTNSLTGKTVSYHQRNTYVHDLAVPGDVGSGIEHDTTHLRVSSANGTVLIDAGLVVLSVEDESVLFQAGQHPIDDYFNGDPSGMRSLCEALAA
jgi:hypothetical protein